MSYRPQGDRSQRGRPSWQTCSPERSTAGLTDVVASAVIASVTLVMSTTGLVDGHAYPTTALREAFAPNDAVTLVLGLLTVAVR